MAMTKWDAPWIAFAMPEGANPDKFLAGPD